MIDRLLSCFSGKNIACTRVFLLLETGSYIIQNIPYIFCSGSAVDPRIPEDVRWLIRNISSYDFVSSSDQAFAHSERAFALSLMNDVPYLDDFRGIYGNSIKGWVIQVHNLSQEMCLACKSFFRCASSYFIDINETGYFVGQEYFNIHNNANKDSGWNDFINFKAGRIKIGALYLEYLKDNTDNENNRKAFLQIMKPHNFMDIIKNSGETPIILFTHASCKYEESLVFKFD